MLITCAFFTRTSSIKHQALAGISCSTMTSGNFDRGICAMCQALADLRCSACKNVYYCHRDHQKRHWKEHVQKCRSFKLADNETVGRHYIAVREINVGEIILREEKALVSGPQPGTVPVCLSCYIILNADDSIPCTTCGWPLCNSCEQHGPECEFSIKHRGAKVTITQFGVPHPTYKSICVIRALSLRELDPKSYEKLMNLQSDYKNDDLNPNDIEECLQVARFIKYFFKIKDVTEDEIAKIVGILQINGHELPITEPHNVAVYDSASYFEHSCRANCFKSFTEIGGIIVTAATPIAKGEHITISYTDPLWGVTNRRHHLQRTKFFDCYCERCRDPTEFGSHFNSLKCMERECGGIILPSTFLISNREILKYDCEKCNFTITGEKIDGILENIGIDLTEMEKDDIETCKNFLKKYSEQLHHNHYYMIDVKIALAQIIGQTQRGLPAVGIELLSEKIALCQSIDELLRTLAPAENRIRGLILYELHAGIAEFGRRQGKSELGRLLMSARKALKESHQMLSHEPDILPEGKIGRIALKNISELDVIMKSLCDDSTILI